MGGWVAGWVGVGWVEWVGISRLIYVHPLPPLDHPCPYMHTSPPTKQLTEAESPHSSSSSGSGRPASRRQQQQRQQQQAQRVKYGWGHKPAQAQQPQQQQQQPARGAKGRCVLVGV